MRIKFFFLFCFGLIVISCGVVNNTASLKSVPLKFLWQKNNTYLASLKEVDNYQKDFYYKVLPYCLPFSKNHTTFTEGTFNHYLNKSVTFGKFNGVDNISVSYATYLSQTENPALVILPGRGESIANYCELIYDLRDSNFNIYIMDFRGQGWAERMTSDAEVGHVENFNHYVSDIQTFMEQIVTKNKHKKVFALAHSMGAAALTLLLEQNDHLFNAVALTAPMFKINTSPYSNNIAYYITNSLCFLGQDKNYIFGMGAYNNYPDFNNPKDNSVTHSYHRFYASVDLVIKYPEIALGGPSNRWLQQSISISNKILNNAEQIRTPLLILQAEKDHIVSPEAQNQLCDKAFKYCQKILIKEAYHEILMEQDNMRTQALKHIYFFFINN